MIIEFLLLSTSLKHGGRCVAGVDLTNNQLIRLVTSDEYETGAIPKEWTYRLNIFSVYSVKIIKKGLNSGAQVENYIIESSFEKDFIRRGTFKDVEPYISKNCYPYLNEKNILTNDEYEAFFSGLHSLLLLQASDIKGYPILNNFREDRENVDFIVEIDGTQISCLNFSCTVVGSTFKLKSFNFKSAILLISLPSDSLGDYRKIVASIIPLEYITGDEKYLNLYSVFD